METSNQCPRCGVGRLRGWRDLTKEDQEVVKRLPASADYSAKHREETHRWCTNCWYEEKSNEPRNV